MNHKYLSSLIFILRRIKIQYRLLAIFFFISLVPVICVGLYSYKVYTNSITNKLGDSSLQAISSMNQNMTTELEKFQNYCDILSVSEPVQMSLIAASQNIEPLSRDFANSINQVLKTIPFQSNYLKNLRVADLSGNILYDLGYDDISKERFDEILSEIDLTSPKDSLQYIHTYRSKDKLVLGRKLYSFYFTHDPIGYIMVYIDEALISDKILSKISFGDGSNIMLINSDGLIMSSQNRSAIGANISEEFLTQVNSNLKNGINSFHTIQHDKNYLVISSYNNQLDCYLIATIPKSYITNETRMINLILLCLSTFLIILSIFCTMVIYFSIVTPIQKMVAFCNTSANQIPTSGIKDCSPDELGVLSTTIDSMLDNLHILMTHAKNDEEKKRMLELQMLQYQINPHFLFNTLNSLQWVAVINDVPTLAQGLSSLSSILQNTLIKKDELIPLSEEINNLEYYFSIQKIRYGNSFEVSYNLNPYTMNHLVPRFILQPLAENSIQHGTSSSADIITITITSSYYDEGLLIELADDGKGFTPHSKDIRKNNITSGIGINNIKERLRLYYDKDNVLEIISQQGKGTVCRITIPTN